MVKFKEYQGSYNISVLSDGSFLLPQEYLEVWKNRNPFYNLANQNPFFFAQLNSEGGYPILRLYDPISAISTFGDSVNPEEVCSKIEITDGKFNGKLSNLLGENRSGIEGIIMVGLNDVIDIWNKIYYGSFISELSEPEDIFL
ncbi:MAG: hypothetical protein QXI33_01190 [Candidatus Pacearchaeota archaeon]